MKNGNMGRKFRIANRENMQNEYGEQVMKKKEAR